MTRLLVLVSLVLFLLSPAVPLRRIVGAAPISPQTYAPDARTVIGSGHFIEDWPPDNPDGSVNAVIEIPSGTTGKFEVTDDGVMHWALDRETGEPRNVDYLPFPANYGMVPRTLADDGDPLDILVLGRGFERGHVARVRVIGVLAMADEGGRDDKLVTVPVERALENGFSRLHELDELDEHYDGLRAILWLYFTNYWGAGNTEILGWGNAREAMDILERAKLRYAVARIARPYAAGPRPRATLPFDGLVRGLVPPRHPRRCGSAC